MKNKLILTFLTIILLTGVFLRSTEVLNGNYLFGFDQGRDYLGVKSIIIDHKLTLIGSEIGAGVAGFRGIFHGPFYYYLLAVPFILFKGDPYGGMLLMFLLGIAAIFFAYIIGKKLFGAKEGLLVATIVAVSPPLIAYSRFIWNSNPTPLFILLAFYFVYLFPKKKTQYLFLAAFFSGFIYNFQLAIAIPLSLSLIIYCIFVLRLRQLKQYIIALLGMFLAFTPMFFFEARHGFQATKGLLNYIFNHPETATTSTFWKLLLGDHLAVFYYNFLHTFPSPFMLPLTITIGVIPPFFYFFIKEKEKPLQQFMIYLLMLIPVTFITLGFLRNFVYDYYLIHLDLVYILLVSFTIISVFKTRLVIAKLLLSGYLIILLSFAAFSNIQTFWSDFSDYGGTHKIKGKLEAIDYIYKDAKGEKFGLLVFSPPIYIYPYDYLVWWHGQRKYNFTPYKEKKGLVYLLIEKDTSRPWTYEGWLKTVIKDGDILETNQLTNGFIVQKRLFKE